MEYSIQEFERDFMSRSLTLLEEYKGEFDATFLLNCLVGLLIVPKERALKKIPKKYLTELRDWGIGRHVVLSESKDRSQSEKGMTLRQFVWRLRNAIAHFRVLPHNYGGKVCAFECWDKSGFRAFITIQELQMFVTSLAEYLRDNWLGPPVDPKASCPSDVPKRKRPRKFSIAFPERVYIIDSPKGLERQCSEIASTCGEFYVYGVAADIPSEGATESEVVADDEDRRRRITTLALRLASTLPPSRRLSVYTNDKQLMTGVQQAVQELAVKRLAHFGIYSIRVRRPQWQPKPDSAA